MVFVREADDLKIAQRFITGFVGRLTQSAKGTSCYRTACGSKRVKDSTSMSVDKAQRFAGYDMLRNVG